MVKFGAHSKDTDFTARELEILQLIANGMSNREIAGELVISIETVRWHNKQLYSKLGVNSRTQAIAHAHTIGLLDGDTPVAPLPAITHNLPTQPIPFVGRSQELEDLFALLADPLVRLITILGPGGMGKSRLALEIAKRLVEPVHESSMPSIPFTDGIFFVSLAPLTKTDNLASIIGDHIGLQFFGTNDPKQQLIDYCRSKSMLLVLDNFEHLLDNASLVSDMLAHASNLQVLVTSRERLNLLEETLYRIKEMAFPDSDQFQDIHEYDAVNLLLQRVRRVRPDFELNADTTRHIIHICQLVQGMPLGILLASSWADSLSLAEIASEISQSLDFLDTDMRNLPPRLRSIRAVFERSWNLLSEDEQAVFMKLAVFHGGFTREAAESVASASLRHLTVLVNKSLLSRDRETGRYDVHELLHQYAAGKLDETPGQEDDSLDQHSDYYCDLLHLKQDDLWKGTTGEQEVLRDMQNIRVAWRRAVMRNKFAAIRKADSGIFSLFEYQGWWAEAANNFEWAAEHLRTAPPSPAQRAALGSVLANGGHFFRRVQLIEEGKRLALESISVLSIDEAGVEKSFANIFLHSHGAGYSPEIIEDYAEMKALLDENLAIYQEIDHTRGLSATLNTLGNVAHSHRDYDQARSYYQQALELARRVNATRDMGWSLIGLTWVARDQSEYKEAREYILENLAVANETGPRLSLHLYELGQIEYLLHNFEETIQAFHKLFKINVDKPFLDYQSLDAFIWLCHIWIQEEVTEEVVEILTLVRKHPATRQETRDEASQMLSTLEGQLPADLFAAAVERGKSLQLEAVIRDWLIKLEE
jgi:predicted ATPase/DNA-binding CsgD family transcriptional regulator